jgi:hypothetical protein
MINFAIFASLLQICSSGLYKYSTCEDSLGFSSYDITDSEGPDIDNVHLCCLNNIVMELVMIIRRGQILLT